MTDKSSIGHNYKFDYIRITACIMVVIIHVSANLMSTVDVRSIDYAVLSSLNGIGFAGVNLFVMISGALMLDPEKEISIKRLLCHNVLRLLAVWYIWTFIYMVSYHFRTGFHSKDEFINLLRSFLCADGTYHLWFIPMLAGLYLLTPVVKPAFSDIKILRYYVILFAIIQIAIPFVLTFRFSGRSVLLDMSQSQPLVAITGYLGYYVLGRWLYVEKFSEKTTRMLLILSGTVVICLSAFSVVRSIQSDTMWLELNSTFTPIAGFGAVFVFTLINSVMGKNEQNIVAGKPKSLRKKIVSFFAAQTFGIYLIHPMILNVLSKTDMFQNIPAVCAAVITLLITISAALLITVVVRMIPKVGKFIM